MIEIEMNTTDRPIVSLKRVSSIPLLVLNEDSADPNSAVPWPLTWINIIPIKVIDITIINMLIKADILTRKYPPYSTNILAWGPLMCSGRWF